MLHRLIMITLFSVLAMFGLAPTSLAAGDTVAAGTYTVTSSNPAHNGTLVSDGQGTVSWTNAAGSGSVWVQNASGAYKKQNPKPNEADLELTFTSSEDGYTWVLAHTSQHSDPPITGSIQMQT